MKLAARASLFLLSFASGGLAQSGGAPRIAAVSPYTNVAPGQIIELRVEDLGEQLLSPPPDDALRILSTQDGGTREARAHGHAGLRQDGHAAEQPRLARPVEGRAEGLSGDELRRAEGLAPGRGRGGGEDELILFTGQSLIVRLPQGFAAGPLRVSVENCGASGYSAPAVATFELSGRR